jgi:hypothetical protein
LINFRFVSGGSSVTIKGLVELPSGLFSDAERHASLIHSVTNNEGEITHGS